MGKEKNEKKQNVKVVKKEEKEIVEEAVIIDKSEKNLIKFIALLSAFFATGMAILIFVFSVIACISVANSSIDALLNNNIVLTVVSKMNNYSISEVKTIIESIGSSRLTFILFEIVVPTIAFVGAMILILVLSKRAIEFIADVSSEKDLYTKRKLINIQDMISILSIVLLTTLVIFNRPSIIIYLLIEALLCIVYLLFKKCVIMRKK